MKLYNYQIENLNKVKDETRVAFYWDMGTGKTFVGSEKLSQLNNTRNLVVCQKSKIDDWVDHFKTHYPKYQVYDLSKRAVGGHDCIKDLLAYDKKFKIGVINYDLVWRRSELLRIKDFVLMLDESSLIQNDTAKRSKFILELGKNASGVILLSGTPIGGKYENLWSQMHLLGWNISKKMYQNQYLEYEYLDGLTKSIPIITGYKNVNRLKRKMDK